MIKKYLKFKSSAIKEGVNFIMWMIGLILFSILVVSFVAWVYSLGIFVINLIIDIFMLLIVVGFVFLMIGYPLYDFIKKQYRDYKRFKKDMTEYEAKYGEWGKD